MVKATVTLVGTAVSCKQCFTLISDGLATLSGIAGISADLREDTLIIDYDSDLLDEDAVRAKLRSLGFTRDRLYCIC